MYKNILKLMETTDHEDAMYYSNKDFLALCERITEMKDYMIAKGSYQEAEAYVKKYERKKKIKNFLKDI